nr:type II secretion system secretin GspD [Desulfobulbaceae bacterium]
MFSKNKLLQILMLTLILCGCSQTDVGEHRTWFDMVEISDKIMRSKHEATVELPPEGEGDVKDPAEDTPRIRDLSMKDDTGNRYIDKMTAEHPERKGEAVEGEGVMLNFDNADIYEVIQVIAETLDLSYVIDPNVKGTVNIRSGQKIPNDQLFTIFKKLLNINGLDIRSEGQHDYIFVAGKPVSMAIYDKDQMGLLKESPKLITQIVPVVHMSSAEAQKLIEPYLSEHNMVYNLAEQNTLIITDFESQIVDGLMILSRMDVSALSSLVVRMFRVEQAPLFDLKDELVEILSALKINKKDYEGVQILPMERVNSLLMIGYNESLIRTALKWAQDLDRAPTEGRDSIYIYNVRNSVATELADLVNSLIKENEKKTTTTTKTKTTRPVVRPPGNTKDAQSPVAPTPGRSSAPSTGPSLASMQFAGEPILIPDDARNIIMVRALWADYKRILKLLGRLDNLPMQVLIEVLVAEVSLTDDLEYGVEWALKNNMTDINDGSVSFKASTGLSSSLIFDANNDIFNLLTFLATKNDFSILSSPQVLVLNNESATVNVGEQVPIVTSETSDTVSSTTSNRTVQYKDTGVILNVTPRINYDGIILLEIDQQVSSVKSATTGGLDSPTISTKSIKTKLAVKDGQSILMGGLIEKNESDTQDGIPLLMDIPFLGNLFKSTTTKYKKTELLIMVTPYVIESENVLDQYVRNFQEKMLELRTELSQ